jgi:hypothetical protein
VQRTRPKPVAQRPELIGQLKTQGIVRFVPCELPLELVDQRPYESELAANGDGGGLGRHAQWIEHAPPSVDPRKWTID